MLFAKVVFGLPVEGPFDYIVPQNLNVKIRPGVRVWVNFGKKETIGYAVALTRKTNIKNLKPILALIDEQPILDENMLLLTKELSDYYCCSWGEAIETALPESLRRRKKFSYLTEEGEHAKYDHQPETILLHDLAGTARWDIYLKHIRETLDNHRSVIVLLPDVGSVFKAREKIAQSLGIEVAILYRKQPQELREWLKIKEGRINIVAGTRSAVFAPLENLGLVIIDEEQDFVYKQDQVPHYHARELAFMRINLERAKLILGSSYPSLESFYLSKINKIKYLPLSRISEFPEIKIIDYISVNKKSKTQDSFLSDYLSSAISSTLEEKGKTLLFLNRKGFATSASCGYCGITLKCPRCNINLVYHFKDNILGCNYCNFKMPAPAICPNCDRGYIRYAGIGTEKIESELARLFPQARIKKIDTTWQAINFDAADIFVSAQGVIKQQDYRFDLVGVLSIDRCLNHVDLRASEKTFGLLTGLLGLTAKKMVIQTRLSYHHAFMALEEKNSNIFYDQELKQRQDLRFPPYAHLGLVKLRGTKEARVKEASAKLFDLLKQNSKDRSVAIMSVNPAQNPKLRGNFYWQILIRSQSAIKISRFLKTQTKKFAHSGIIVTVDIDPI